MADDDLAEAIRRLQAADALGNQVGLTTPEGSVFDTVTNEALPPASTTFDPNSEHVWSPIETPRIAEGGASGSWDQPGPVPSPLPPSSASDWAPRAELVKLPPSPPVSMASRDMWEHPPPRATLVDPDPDEQYFSDPNLGQAVKRAQLVDPDPDSLYLPPGQEDNPEAQNAAVVGQAVKRATLVDPDPDQAYLDAAAELDKPPTPGGGLAPIAQQAARALKGVGQPAQKKSPQLPSVTTAPQISPSAVSAPSPSSLTFNPETDSITGQPIAPRAIPAGAAPPIQPAGAIYNQSLADSRNRIAQELEDPLVRQKLMASIQAEVGDQGMEAHQAYVESVMNRALARGMTLNQTISDTGYYPQATISRLDRTYSGTEATRLDGYISKALAGSNVANFATGNESGSVRSGGAPVVYNPGTGERFVVENQDKGWMGQAQGAPAQVAGGPFSRAALGFDLGSAAEPEQLKAALVADQANQQKQWGILQGVVTQDKTPGELVGILSKPIDGVNDAMRQNFLSQYTKEITSEAQQFYGIKDPKQAYNKAISSPDFGAVSGEVIRKVVPYMNQAVTAFNQSAAQIDQNRLDYLARTLHPDATPEGRRAFITSITSISDPAQRAITINKLIGDYAASAPQNPALATLDAATIANSADRLADPEFQKRQKDEIARQVDANVKALQAASDPRLRGTGVGFVADQIAQLPKNMIEAFGGPIGRNLMLAEIYQGTVERIKHDNPGISDEDAQAKATGSTVAQYLPAEILQELTGGLLGGVTRGIVNPAARIATSALVHAASGGSVGTAQQIASNLAEGRPMFEGVGPAAVAGAVQAAPGGVIGGLHRAPEEIVPRGTLPEERVLPSKEQPALTEEPAKAEQKPPVPPPPVREEPPLRVEPEPVEVRPLEDVEADLNRQNQELDKRYDAEQKLAPIEEEEVPTDITERERAAAEQERISPVEELRRPDLGAREEQVTGGRDVTRGEEPVPFELGRVPGTLETRLSDQERAAFKPELDALKDNPPFLRIDPVTGKDHLSPDFVQAYRALREKVIARFQPILDAMGVKRNPDDFGNGFAAGIDLNGKLDLDTHLQKGAQTLAAVIRNGGDPLDRLHSVLQEEIIHFAKHLVSVDEYNRTGGAAAHGNLYKFQQAEHRRILTDLVRARDEARSKGNTKLANDIETAMQRSDPVYRSIGREMSATELEAHFKSMLSDPNPNRVGNMVHELVRQIVQIRSGNPITEKSFASLWQGAKRWYQAALRGLKGLALRLGPGRSGAKLELARAVRATEAKIAEMDALSHRAAQGERGGAPAAGRLAPEAPGLRATRDWLAERLRKAKASYGLAFKSGESAMLDYEETRNLARAIRRKPSLQQAYGQRARLEQLYDAFASVPRSERDRVKREFTEYTRAEQTRQPLPAVGADTQRLINASKDTLEGFGQIAKELNVHVRDSNGRIRPMRLIGREYYPRMISEDTRDIFNNRDGSRAADFNNLLQRQIARGVVKDRQEFIDKFTHAINGEPHSNDQFSNLERAREAQLPLEFYDFSPEALVRYAGRAGDRLAQVGAFGQKLSNKGKDMFDLAIDKVNQSGNLSYQAKEALINRIASERKAQYGATPASGLERTGSFARNVASGLYLSNWQTAFRNLVTGAAQNMVFGGPSSFIRAAAQFPSQWRQIITEARDRNLFRSNLRNVLDDYDLATNPNWWERGGRRMADLALKYGGHNLTEAINRSFAMQQAKVILRDFARDYGVNDNAISRARNELIARRFGFRHSEDASRTLTALAREGGAGPLTDEFIRQQVMDVHANYGPGQSPAHLLNNPAGKMLFQFQRWGANAARMMTREYVMPWTRAMQSGTFADKGYHTLRMLGFLAAGTGVGGLFQSAINAVYRRDPKDPTLAEIGKTMAQGDQARAFSYAVQKAYGLMLLSGFSGLFGDYAGMIQEHMGKDPGGRFKDPLHPPAFSILEPFMALYQGWRGEGGALPSPKLMDEFLQKLSSTYRVSKQAALGLSNSAGIKMLPAEEYQAENDRNFTRQRIAMYEAQDPALQQKAEQKGTQATIVSMAGRSPFSPVRDKIIGGLLSGNAEEANSAIREWLTKTPIEARKAEFDKIKSNINNNSPLKVGGSSKPEAVMGFLSWAKDNLPEGEARKIFALAQTYAKTAMATGLESSSKSMLQMSRLDYDKFKTPTSMGTAQQAASTAKATAQGRVVMQQLIARQRAAQALQGR